MIAYKIGDLCNTATNQFAISIYATSIEIMKMMTFIDATMSLPMSSMDVEEGVGLKTEAQIEKVHKDRQHHRGGRHSSVVSSARTILRPQVRIPSTSSMLLQFVIDL